MYKTKALLLLSLLTLSLILVACSGSDQSTTATPTPSPTPQMAHSTLLTPPPTTPPATVVPQPTSTIVTKPADLQGQVLEVAQKAAKKASAVSVDSQSSTNAGSPGGAAVVVLDDLNTQDQEAIKKEVFNLQKAVWTSPASKQLGMFMVWITQGQTSAGDPVIVTRASLSKQKASTIQWGTLTPDTAWNLYDQTSGENP